MRNDDFIGKAFYWFTGEVEDVNDPAKMNRVRVRCHGYHGGHPTQASKSFKDVAEAQLHTGDLPWATVMMPSTSQSSKGYGRTHELEKGSWVVGFFRDGLSAQDPLVLGSISTMTGDIIDIPEKASGADNYPNNKVYKSEGGHIIEIDNGTLAPAVPGIDAVAEVEASEGVEAVAAVTAVAAIPASRSGETIRVTHVGGSQIEIDENNNLTVYVEEGGDLTIGVKQGNTTITTEEGDTKIITGGNTNIESTGDCIIKSTGRSRYTSGKEIIIQAVDKTRIM